jgi:hypothetical protein
MFENDLEDLASVEGVVHLATTDQPKITSRRPINPETVWGKVKEAAC